MNKRPRLKLSAGHSIECIGTKREGSAPYLFFGNHDGLHVASGPLGTTKREMRSLETFLRRSLEAVTGKKVVLK
jgi:hypothetical protein